jgi:hypothetical protein
MIRSFRAFFLGRAQRERAMLVVFALMLVGFWFSHFSDQVKRFWDESRRTSADLAMQAQFLAARADIMASAQKAAGQFDPSSTLNAAGLLAAANQMATDAGILNTRGEPDQQDESTGQFAVHTVHFTIPKTDWPSLLNFYVALRKRHPYIGIDKFNIGSLAGAAAVNVDLTLSSVEVVRGTE